MNDKGKFEGEPAWVPYFYDKLCMDDGFVEWTEDAHTGECWDILAVEEDEKKAFEDYGFYGNYVVLYQTGDGFVFGSQHRTIEEARACMPELERKRVRVRPNWKSQRKIASRTTQRTTNRRTHARTMRARRSDMWCVIGIPVALVAGYFLAAMMFNVSHADDTSYDATDWSPYDKPTVIRMKKKETDDGNGS